MSRAADALPEFDAWVFARLLFGHDLDGELAHLSESSVLLADHLAGLPAEGRQAAWNAFVEGEPDGEAWVEAVAAVDPASEAPEIEAGADDGSGWKPLRLGGLPDVEPFPVDVFPGAVRRLVEAGSEAIGCAPDFLALPVLAVAGGVIGRSVGLRLKANYFVSGCVYAAVIGPPSDGKTPALKIVAAPVRKIDDALAVEWARAKAEFDDASSKAEGGGRGRSKGRDPDADLADAPTRPVPRRIDIDDATMEVLPLILAANARGLVMIRDELTAFVLGMNQFKGGKGNDRSNALKIWSGDAIKKDRVGHEDQAPIRAPFPTLTILGGLTPDMLGELADPQGRSDGFLDRFLLAYPDPRPVPEWSEVGLPPELAEDWAAVVLRLWQRPMRAHEGKMAPHVASLGASGKAAWVVGYDAHAREMNADDFPPALRGPWGKFREYAGRLALILALLRHAADPTLDPVEVPDVEARDVADAWRLVAYFKGHARRVGAAMQRKGGLGEDAGTILRWVRRLGLEAFPQSELTRNFPRFRDDPDTLGAALKKLGDANCLRIRPELAPPPGRRGRKPLPTFEVNPALHAPENCDNCGNPGHSEGGIGQGASENCVNCGNDSPGPNSSNYRNSPGPQGSATDPGVA